MVHFQSFLAHFQSFLVDFQYVLLDPDRLGDRRKELHCYQGLRFQVLHKKGTMTSFCSFKLSYEEKRSEQRSFYITFSQGSRSEDAVDGEKASFENVTTSDTCTTQSFQSILLIKIANDSA